MMLMELRLGYGSSGKKARKWYFRKKHVARYDYLDVIYIEVAANCVLLTYKL